MSLPPARCHYLPPDFKGSSIYTYIYIYIYIYIYSFFLLWRCDPTRVMASSSLRFLHHTQRRTTVGRTPLDEWSARRTALWQNTTFTTNIHAPGGIRTHDLSMRAAANLRLRPHGHWDGQLPATTNVCKTRGCNYSFWAPDDERCVARNMLSF